MPRKPNPGPPPYRSRTDYGRKYAIVTLTDPATKRRRTYRLGPYDTAESRQRYAQLLASWEARRCALPDAAPPPSRLTVTQLCFQYWRGVEGRYAGSHRTNIAVTIRELRGMFGATPADEFGPKKLALLRESWVAADLSRSSIAKRVHLTGAIFKWATANELLSVMIYQALKTRNRRRSSASACAVA